MDTVQLVEFFEEKTAIIFYYIHFSWVVALLHVIEDLHLCPSSTTRTCLLPESGWSQWKNVTYLPARLVFKHWGEILDIDYRFVSGDENMELCICGTLLRGLVEEFKLFDDVSGILVAIEWNSTQPWRPSFKFSHPVGDCGIWHNNENWKGFPLFGYIP